VGASDTEVVLKERNMVIEVGDSSNTNGVSLSSPAISPSFRKEPGRH